MSKIDPYNNYTSTSALPDGFDEKSIKWTEEYVKYNFVNYFPKKKNLKILEIGCGWGKYVKALQNLNYKEVCGIDISAEQIEFGRENLELNNISKQDAMDYLSKTKDTYDVIIMADVMEHLELDYSLQLGSVIHEKLKNQGVFIMQVPNGMSLLNPIRYSDITHQRSYTVFSSNQFFKLIGFKDIHINNLKPFPKGIKRLIRLVLWNIIIEPLIKIYMLVANGDLMGGVYTSNLIAVGRKN